MAKSLSESGKKHNRPDPAILLAWYDRHARVLPWRAKKGHKPDPYRVWLSEIMLQQTTVAAVGPYFVRFIERWPRIEGLAQAKLDDVLRMWAGLGYYRRARMLYACAKEIVIKNKGLLPCTEKELLSLPGIGPYTAAAIAAIAFGQKANVVDGNVERIMARLYAVEKPLPSAKPVLRALASALVPDQRPGDYAQALMDLGATICTPKAPKCPVCPWRQWCKAFDSGSPQAFPARSKRAEKPHYMGVAFVLFDEKGRVFLRRRPDTGLLAGMMEVPSSAWKPRRSFSFSGAPINASWRWSSLEVRHTFTHFTLTLRVAVARVRSLGNMGGRWVRTGALDREALPSVMRKVLADKVLREGRRAR